MSPHPTSDQGLATEDVAAIKNVRDLGQCVDMDELWASGECQVMEEWQKTDKSSGKDVDAKVDSHHNKKPQPTSHKKREQVHLFGIDIDPVTMTEAVARVMEWTGPWDGQCRYVVTPNTDHVVLFQKSAELRAAYARAGLVLTDGMPIVLASRLLGQPVPERVTGADLTMELLAAATEAKPLSVYLLGAGPGVAERAAENAEAKWPAVSVVGTYSPPFGFEKDEAENEAILKRIQEAAPDILVVGLGAPKQELWVHQYQHRLHAKVALCVGATIDFLAGEKPRAPLWMQRCGLEWFHRMLSDPRRLLARYAYDAWVLPQLIWDEWWASSDEEV